jgi:hypothetical protein
MRIWWRKFLVRISTLLMVENPHCCKLQLASTKPADFTLG